MIHSTRDAVLSDLGIVTDRAIRDLRSHADEFDSIAAQGVSGLIVASPVSLALNKPLIIVRKDSDLLLACAHVSVVENAARAGRRVLFLDDYAGGGRTLRDVARKLRDHTSGELTARYEYTYGDYITGAERAAR